MNACFLLLTGREFLLCLTYIVLRRIGQNKKFYLCKTGVAKDGYTSDNDYIENIGDIV